MGFADTFLHADYVSAVYRTDYSFQESTPDALIIGIVLLFIGLGLFIYFHIKKNMTKKKIEDGEKKPP